MNLPDFLTQDESGEIRLTGHRVGLYTVVRYYKDGLTAEEIAAELPTLRLAVIFRVLAFYLENEADVNAYFDAHRAEIERQASLPPGSGVIKARRLLESQRLSSMSGEEETR